MRKETRAERYASKASIANKLPFSFCATYFQVDGNLAYLSRALACFGGDTVHIIGKTPNMSEIQRLSGGHSKLVKFKQFPNPMDFVYFADDNGFKIIVAELTEGAKSLFTYKWDYDVHSVIVVGNEMDGVPKEIVDNAHDLVFIPMTGQGFCLNTSQTANVMAYDYAAKKALQNG